MKLLKEFQSLENDDCHTVVFGNIATVVASCKTLHWMQMADESNVFKHEKNCFSHNLQEISTLRNFRKFPEFFFGLNLFFFIEFFFDKNVFSDTFFKEFFIAVKTITLY